MNAEIRNAELRDVYEFAELYKQLTREERTAVKNIIIGIQIGRPQQEAVKTA